MKGQQKRHGFILVTSVGLSLLVLTYTLGVLPMKQQALLTIREERQYLEKQLEKSMAEATSKKVIHRIDHET